MAPAARSSSPSAPRRAISCRPSGRPSSVLYLTRRLAGLAIERSAYRRLFSADVLKEFASEVEALAEAKLIEVTRDSIRPTPLGSFYADSAASLLARRRTE